jgi:hypothetical protein
MHKIFISYRRDDSAYVTGMLAEKLQQVFGKTSVFLDIDTIPFGVDIREHISRAVGECDILLAVTGTVGLTRQTMPDVVALTQPQISCGWKLNQP